MHFFVTLAAMFFGWDEEGGVETAEVAAEWEKGEGVANSTPTMRPLPRTSRMCGLRDGSYFSALSAEKSSFELGKNMI